MSCGSFRGRVPGIAPGLLRAGLLALTVGVGAGPPGATPPGSLKLRPGFQAELLYTVPKDTQGSWVSMTIDPKGRLIVSDQYGKLYRVTPPPLKVEGGGDVPEPKVEPIAVDVGEAQGLCWAFDSLYVVVNRGAKFPSGLYRVRDTNDDGDLDSVELLRKLDGASEHGPHAVVLAPDGKSLYVVAGNATKLTELAGSLVPRHFGEDQILPYMPDGRGFMRDERAPGGCIYKVTPDGKDWVLVSMGYRNAYDLAFNFAGDLFTFDSDMEWDFNTPWYRPTRVCQADSGSDFGYRNGSGKWPTYYPDSLPPVVDIGPGSPTGITFGYGAKFPYRYRAALYLCDWSYGRLFAVHLTPDGSSYKAEFEEFISGVPLPLTDLVVNPADGALYFAIGGRKTLSGLYRVTFHGPDPNPADDAMRRVPSAGGKARELRRSLEAFHGHADPKAVATVWPHLNDPDRYIRYAARVALEFQDPTTWQDRALAEKDPEASLTALLALVRTGDKALRPRVLDALDRLDWKSLSESQKLELLRDYELAYIRMGKPDSETVARGIAKLDPLYPAPTRPLNAELSKLLIFLQAPDAASKTLALLEQAPTQEEQMDYAASLRLLRAGWTPALRRRYFAWFPKMAASGTGGMSYLGFLKEIKVDAVDNLDTAEKEELKPLLDAKLEPAAAKAAAPLPSRPFVQKWTVDELAAAFERGSSGRDYERGRSLFAAVSCFSCHRFNNEGGAAGPDLSVVANRFSPRDLLESIIEPSKVISDQYGALNVATSDGKVFTGRLMNLHGDTYTFNTNMLDPAAQVNVNRDKIEVMEPSRVSMMPQGLLDTLKEDEALDLLAYLLSRGDRSSPLFRH